MFVRTLNFKISIAKWTDNGGGVQPSLLDEAEMELNKLLENLRLAGYNIIDIKVNHYTVNRHNNGGADEVWVQYTILYKQGRYI